MPPPLYMGSQPWPLLLAAVMVLSLLPASAEPPENPSTMAQGALLDVMVLPSSCISNETCEAHRPSHLIEYFSADWCEPCEQVGRHLRNMSDGNAFVLQHHPSPQDATFLTDSKLRNDEDYRLMFYPSLVVDGDHLLTGTRQAMDLESVMENQTVSWSGLDDVVMANGTLRWNASVNETLTVWLVAPTPHETTGEIHPSVAYQRYSGDADVGELLLNNDRMTDNTSVVVLLEREGVRSLTVASLAPTGSLDPNDGGEATGMERQYGERILPLLVGLLLILALLPAVFSHVLILRTKETSTVLNAEEE